MPKIIVSAIIESDIKSVFNLIKDIERFPEFMRDVKSIRILENLPDRIISEWQTDIDGTPISWTEEDIFDETTLTWRFKAIKSDYKYEGVWSLEEINENKTKVSVVADFDWEVPNFEKYFGKVYEKKAKNSLKSMLNALKKRLKNG